MLSNRRGIAYNVESHISDPLLYQVPPGRRGMFVLEVTSVMGGHVSVDRVCNATVGEVFGDSKATRVWRCMALLDRGGPVTFIFNKVWMSMVQCGAVLSRAPR